MASEIRFRITTDEQLEAALERIAEPLPFKRGTPEYQELTILLIAAKAYKPPKKRQMLIVETVH